MKQILSLFLIVALLLVVGCSQTKVVSTEPEAAPSTEVAVQEVDADISDIADIDADLDFSDLDSIEDDLNFG